MTEAIYFTFGVIGTLLTSTIISLIEFRLTLSKLKNSISDVELGFDKKTESMIRQSNSIHKQYDEKFQVIGKIIDEKHEHLRKLSDGRHDSTMVYFNTRCDKLTSDLISAKDEINGKVSNEIHQKLNSITRIAYDDSSLKNYILELDKRISTIEQSLSDKPKVKTPKNKAV